MTSAAQTGSSAEASFAADDTLARELVRGLAGVRPAVYWTDLLLTSAAGWSAFAAAVLLRPFSPLMLASVVIAALALYRALCFVHELSHQTRRTIPHFESAWNLLIGYPLLLPSLVYVGVHQNHHRLSTYGTPSDPEYLPFAGSSRMTVAFALQSFLIPAALVIRFLVLAPLSLMSPSLRRWLVIHASSLTMSPSWQREYTPELDRTIARQSATLFGMWAAFVSVALVGALRWRFFAVWFAVSALISFVNTLRTLAAHAYESAGEPLDRRGQLIDSIDTPGAFWTELWAPVGLRYHALHHYFPGVPYHNLPEAFRRLSRHLSPNAEFHRTRRPGLRYSLWALFRKGLG